MTVRIGLMVVVVALVSGCVPLAGGWDVSALRERYPEAMNESGQRLGDTPPYFIPHRDAAVLFLCRFSTRAPIRVSLPGGATKSERSAIRVALDGWEEAGLGIEFSEVAAESAMIEIRFADSPTGPSGVAFAGTGYTVSDCGFEADWADWAERNRGTESEDPVPAHLTAALVHLRRSNTDVLGHEVMLGVDELVGVALHELGHALGFPGHVATADSVMSKSTDMVRRFGRRLLTGDGFAAPSLVSLYGLPSGTVVGSTAVPAEDLALFNTARAFAEDSNWRGPYVRVGEHSAKLSWWRDGVPIAALEIRDYRESLNSGLPLAFSPGRFERALRAPEPPAS